MRRLCSLTGALGVAALAASCAAPPPAELSGLWSAGPAACAAGVGVRFGDDAIAAIYDHDRQTLFEHPRYYDESRHGVLRVRIEYSLPQQPGGAVSAGAEGVLELGRASDGGLEVLSHNLLDHRTGTAQVRIVGDPAADVLRLVPCDGAHPVIIEQLRGRAET